MTPSPHHPAMSLCGRQWREYTNLKRTGVGERKIKASVSQITVVGRHKVLIRNVQLVLPTRQACDGARVTPHTHASLLDTGVPAAAEGAGDPPDSGPCPCPSGPRRGAAPRAEGTEAGATPGMLGGGGTRHGPGGHRTGSMQRGPGPLHRVTGSHTAPTQCVSPRHPNVPRLGNDRLREPC